MPASFDVRTLVLLLRPDDPPAIDDATLDDLQLRHLAFYADLAARGVVAANGPMRSQTDERLRGMTVYTTGVAEALAIAGDDPLVRAGRLRLEAARWCVAEGDVAFPRQPGPVGDVVPFECLDD